VPNQIVLVEDDFDARSFLYALLKLSGYSVALAADGQEGLQKITSDPPDLIITDVAMPRLNGLGLIRTVRATPILSNIPILAVTSFGKERANEALEAGASTALARPIQNDHLLQAIKKLIKGDADQRAEPAL